MKKNFTYLVCLVILTIGCNTEPPKPPPPQHIMDAIQNSLDYTNDKSKLNKLMKEDCVEYIELVSAKELAQDHYFGRTERWVVANHRTHLWSKTSINGKGKVVGELLSGSRGIIIDRSGGDYKIQSPLDKSIGWVNNIQVKRTLYQHPKTFKECSK